MAKPLMMTIAVEEAFFGKIYRTLDNMPGVATITIHSEGVKGNGAAPPTGGRGQKRGGTQSSECVVLGALRKGPQVRSVLTEALNAAGKKGEASIAVTMRKLHTQKQVTKKGTGKNVTYTITKAGEQRYATACQIEGAE